MIAKRQSTSTSIVGGSPERFGYEWSVYAELRPEYEEQFRRWTAHLSPDDWKGRTFLDVGCGMGRNSIWPMTYGAAGGIAVDVDARSLRAARANLSRYPRVAIEERSAYSLGYHDQFDIVFSIGVTREQPLGRDTRRSAASCGVQPDADCCRPSPVALSRGAAMGRAAVGLRTNRILASAAANGLFPSALDRLRSDAAEDRQLLATRNSSATDGRNRT
jgi:SAM-dependent methyltransferase